MSEKDRDMGLYNKMIESTRRHELEVPGDIEGLGADYRLVGHSERRTQLDIRTWIARDLGILDY